MAERKRTTRRSSASSNRGASPETDEAREAPDAEFSEDEVSEDEATAEAEAVEEGDPLAAQGYGEEDFSRRDYIIPGVDADDPDPYKWHTGQKRDHGGEDAIEIIDLVKQFGRTRILNGCNLGPPGQHDLDGARPIRAPASRF